MKSALRLPAFLTAVYLSLCCSCLSVFARSEVANVPSADGSAAQSSAAKLPAFSPPSTVVIPGPLRSFLRMAAISQKISPEEVLPLLAREVFSEGYRSGRPTEFLVLLSRYVHQARELTALAGPDGSIRVSNCDEATPLLRILGYRLAHGCGQSGASLVTGDPERAFLTLDSGFPLPGLEETLQGGKPFVYPFPSSPVPVMFTESDWLAASNEGRKGASDLIDALLRDLSLARLYWALGRTDAETRAALERSPGLGKLLPFAADLDFYGSHIKVRSGRVIVPGGPTAESGWKDLVGASPDSPGEFVPRLLAKDKGWLAAYFDALSRVNQAQQTHFTEPHRLKRC